MTNRQHVSVCMCVRAHTHTLIQTFTMRLEIPYFFVSLSTLPGIGSLDLFQLTISQPEL